MDLPVECKIRSTKKVKNIFDREYILYINNCLCNIKNIFCTYFYILYRQNHIL